MAATNTTQSRRPGEVRDAVARFLKAKGSRGATVAEVRAAVSEELGEVAPSSVRSILRINNQFAQIDRGTYRYVGRG